MFISVIIPTCNRNEALNKCLDLLAPQIQNFGKERCEVIITDDSKNNETERMVAERHKWVSWVKGPQKGPAANRNNGAKNAKGDWLIFLDDDVLPNPALISEYIKGINENPASFAYEGAIFPDDEKLLQKDMAECPVNKTGGFFWSANICISMQLFKSISGFNEMYIIAAQEDQQMKIDIEQRGEKILFIKDASVIHPVRFTSIKKQVQRIPVASKNFCIYAFNNKDQLGYTSVSRFFLSQCAFHIKAILNHLKECKTKSIFVSVIFLFYGLPLNIFNFYKRSSIGSSSFNNK